MAPRETKATEKKTRKPHQSKDYNAFLIVLPLVDNDIPKATKIVAEMRAQGVF